MRTWRGRSQQSLLQPTLTSGQIIAAIVAIVLAGVLYPVGARAAGQLVTIIDPTTTSQAKVDSAGKLLVGDGSGKLTVDGKVATTVALPANPWHFTVTGTALLFNAPSGVTTLAISSLTFANLNSGSTSVFVDAFRRSGGCGTPSALLSQLLVAFVPVSDTRHFDFPQPLTVVRSDSDWCVEVLTSANTVTTGVGSYGL